MEEIILTPSPNRSFRVLLDDQDCTINLYQRGAYMYLDLVSGDVPICKGAICQDGADVVQSVNPAFRGTLHFVDTLGTNPPQWQGLGERYVMLYVPEGEEKPERLRF